METSWRGCWFWNRGSCMIVLWELRMNHHPILTEKSRIFPELELYIWWCWATCLSTTKRLGNAQSAKQSEVKSQTTAGHETHRKIIKVLEKIFFCSLYLPFLEKQPILYNKSKIYIYLIWKTWSIMGLLEKPQVSNSGWTGRLLLKHTTIFTQTFDQQTFKPLEGSRILNSEKKILWCSIKDAE